MDWIFSLLCHQLPERSPHFAGEQFVLCYRCAGMYLGVAASAIYLFLSGGFRRSFPRLPALIAGGVLMLPFVIDGWANTLHLWNTPGWARLLTGLGHGLMLPLVLVPIAAANVLPDDWQRARSSLPSLPALLIPVSLGLMLCGVLLAPTYPVVFVLLNWLVEAALLFMLIMFGVAAVSLRRILPRIKMAGQHG